MFRFHILGDLGICSLKMEPQMKNGLYCSRIDYEIINSTKLHPTQQDTTTMAAEEVRVDKWINRNGNLIV